MPRAEYLYKKRSDSVPLIARKLEVPETQLRERLCKRMGSPNKRIAEAEFKALKATIPKDTRTPGQILTGDPLYERSALYRIRQEGRA